MKYLLDTHAWVWWHMRPERLSQRVRDLIGQPRRYQELLLSAISVWEFCKLLEKGRLAISCDTEEWLGTALAMPRLRLVPLTPRIACKSTALPQPFTSDPADEIIVATAREEKAAILTKDEIMRNYPHVETLW